MFDETPVKKDTKLLAPSTCSVRAVVDAAVALASWSNASVPATHPTEKCVMVVNHSAKV